MKLLPRHSESGECNCKDKFLQTKPSKRCKWVAAERDSACGWALRIYEKLKTDLETRSIVTLHGLYALVDCWPCNVERGCCKKRKLMLAMTSQILDWLKKHQNDLLELSKYSSSVRY